MLLCKMSAHPTPPIGPAARQRQREETLSNFVDAIYACHNLEKSSAKRYDTDGLKRILESPQYAHTSQLACDLLQCLNDDTNKEILMAKEIYEQNLGMLEEIPDPGAEFFDMKGQIDEITLKRYAEEMLAWLPEVRTKEKEMGGIANVSEAIGQLTIRISKLQGKLDVHAIVKQVDETQRQLCLLQDNISLMQKQCAQDAEDVHVLTAKVQRLLDSQPPHPSLNPQLQNQVDIATNNAIQQLAHPAILSIQTNVLQRLERQQEEDWSQAWSFLQQPLTLIESVHIWLEGELRRGMKH